MGAPLTAGGPPKIKNGPLPLKFGMTVGNGIQMLNTKEKNNTDNHLINYS